MNTIKLTDVFDTPIYFNVEHIAEVTPTEDKELTEIRLDNSPHKYIVKGTEEEILNLVDKANMKPKDKFGLFVARDEDGTLALYNERPIVQVDYDSGQRNYFLEDEDNYLTWWGELDETLFPEVTFETGPVRVELKLVEQ
jgi:hypothetical protein